MTDSPDSIVIVGAGQAGAQTAISLRQAGFEGSVTLLGSEPQIPYERPPLSKKFLAGEVGADQLFMRAPDFYTDKNIAIRTNTNVSRIDRNTKRVHLAGEKACGRTQARHSRRRVYWPGSLCGRDQTRMQRHRT